MRVVISYNAEGARLASVLAPYAASLGHEVVELANPEADCVDIALAAATDVLAHPGSRGIVVDAYGVGAYMAACKVKGMVCANISDERSAYMTREHNNSTMITLGAQIVGDELAKSCVREFLAADYAGGRHQIRVDMLNKMA